MADWNRRRLTNIFGALLNLKNGSINQTSTRRIKSKIEQTWGADVGRDAGAELGLALGSVEGCLEGATDGWLLGTDDD
jgi:hypothetical protein